MEAIGEPDVEEAWYSTGKLFEILDSKVRTKGFDLVIGVTDLALAWTDETGKIDKNYFSLSDTHQISAQDT